jgi:alpha-mannosidase
MYKIVIDASKGGIIKQLIAKKEKNKDFVNGSGQYLLGELRGHFYDEGRFHSSTETAAKITILEDSPFRTIVKIEGTIASHPFAQIISIAQNQKRIDFDLTIDWKENIGIGEYKQSNNNWRENRRGFYDDRFKLNVLFPVNLESPKLYKNAPFDVCESRLGNTFFNSWDKIKHNVILNWVDLVQSDGKYGIALLSDHTTSYSFGGDFPLGLTAQYSGVGLWGVDYKITQPLKMKYAIIPHKGKWDDAAIATESMIWNEPLIYSLHSDIEQKAKSLIDMKNSGYEISAVKMDGNDVIVRLFNAEGDKTPQKITFNFQLSSIDEIDLNGGIIEKNVNRISANNNISISMPRFGIKTFKINRSKI